MRLLGPCFKTGRLLSSVALASLLRLGVCFLAMGLPISALPELLQKPPLLGPFGPPIDGQTQLQLDPYWVVPTPAHVLPQLALSLSLLLRLLSPRLHLSSIKMRQSPR